MRSPTSLKWRCKSGRGNQVLPFQGFPSACLRGGQKGFRRSSRKRVDSIDAKIPNLRVRWLYLLTPSTAFDIL